MTKIMTLALAAAMSLSAIGFAQAQTTGQQYKSPEDCVADYGKLDVNGDGMIDNNEMSKYTIVRTNVDTNNDGMISTEERTVACKAGLAKAFRPAG